MPTTPFIEGKGRRGGLNRGTETTNESPKITAAHTSPPKLMSPDSPNLSVVRELHKVRQGVVVKHQGALGRNSRREGETKEWGRGRNENVGSRQGKVIERLATQRRPWSVAGDSSSDIQRGGTTLTQTKSPNRAHGNNPPPLPPVACLGTVRRPVGDRGGHAEKHLEPHLGHHLN